MLYTGVDRPHAVVATTGGRSMGFVTLSGLFLSKVSPAGLLEISAPDVCAGTVAADMVLVS